MIRHHTVPPRKHRPNNKRSKYYKNHNHQGTIRPPYQLRETKKCAHVSTKGDKSSSRSTKRSENTSSRTNSQNSPLFSRSRQSFSVALCRNSESWIRKRKKRIRCCEGKRLKSIKGYDTLLKHYMVSVTLKPQSPRELEAPATSSRPAFP